MDKLKDLSLTQATLALIAKVNVSTISRKISQDNIPSIDFTSPRKRYGVDSSRKILDTFFGDKKASISKKTQVFYNFKGGTGKTTITYQTASLLCLMGFKVLAIDCDPQGHLTNAFQFNEYEQFKTIYDAMINSVPLKDIILPVCSGMDLIPSNLGLTRIEVPLAQKTRREEILTKLISQIQNNYDFILIDTNPTISTLNMNALFASDHINIVCETQPFSLSGLGILVDELEHIFYEMQKPFQFTILANKYESKTATAQEVLGVLRTDYKANMAQTVIRKCEDINVSTKNKIPVYGFASKNSAAIEDLIDLTHELLGYSVLQKKSAA